MIRGTGDWLNFLGCVRVQRGDVIFIGSIKCFKVIRPDEIALWSGFLCGKRSIAQVKPSTDRRNWSEFLNLFLVLVGSEADQVFYRNLGQVLNRANRTGPVPIENIKHISVLLCSDLRNDRPSRWNSKTASAELFGRRWLSTEFSLRNWSHFLTHQNHKLFSN